jgi:hypothetical protein
MSARRPLVIFMVLGLVALFAAGALIGASAAHAQASEQLQPPLPRRIAFVIGNSAYRFLPRLANPANDTRAIAAGFVEAGYEVVGPLLDLDRRTMQTTIAEFANKAGQAEVAVFYFAGHGIEFGGENYLLPIDAKLRRESEAQKQAIKLSTVITAASYGRQLKVVILDACRDNPLAAAHTTHGVNRGLANIEPSAGVLVAFAARHGTSALDGVGGANSPFTAALLGQLSSRGMDVVDLFAAVAKAVSETTMGRQEPYTYGAVDVGREKRAALVAWRPERTSRPRPILPHSSQREVTEDELVALTCGELYLARNEIFARNGYCFTTERGRVNFNDNRGCTTSRQIASDTELANARAIQLYEQKRQCVK